MRPRHSRQDIECIGRDAELNRLRAALTHVHAGRGQLVVLHGEAGIGKTTLARAFADEMATSRINLLWGRGIDGEWLPPYAPWREALDQLEPLSLFESLRAESERHDGTRSGDLARPVLAPEEGRFRFHQSVVAELRQRAGQQPIAIVLDDLQWMDDGSIELLLHLVHFGLDMPLFMLATYREPGRPDQSSFSRLLRILRRSDQTEFIGLAGLQSPDVALMLAAGGLPGVTSGVVDRMVEATAGSPLFLSELIRHWRELPASPDRLDAETLRFSPMNEGLHAVITSRFEQLSQSTSWILRQIAIFDAGFEFVVLPHLTGLAESELLDAIDELLDARLIVAQVGRGFDRYEIVHALVRETLLQPLSPSRRVRLERLAAEAMERAYGAAADMRAAELAIQYGRSASLPGAEAGLRFALIAATRARRGFDRQKLVAFLEIARDLAAHSAPEVRAPILCELAIAQADLVQIADACSTAARALETLELSDAPRERIASFLADLVMALKHHASAPPQIWRPLLETGLDAAGKTRDALWARLMLLHDPVEPVSRDEIRAGRWRGFDREAISIARAGGDERTIARAMESFDYRSRQETDDYLALVHSWSDPLAIMFGLTVVANDLQYRHGAFSAAELIWLDLISMARRHGAINWQAQAMNQLTILYLGRGRFAEAREREIAAIALLDQLGPGRRSHVLELEMETAFALELGGDWRMLAERWKGVVADHSLEPHDPATLMSAHYAALAAYCFAEAGDRVATHALLEALTPILEAMTPRDANQNGAVAFAGAAAWRLQLGMFAPRLLLLAEGLEAAGLGNYPQTSIALTIARMVAITGEHERARREFARARVLLDASGERPLRAVVDLDEAGWLKQSGDRSELSIVQALAAQAHAAFERLGMTEWLLRARALDDGEAEPEPVATEVPGGLSQREVEVLRLVARGYSDRQISEQLFVSPRTINAHIRNMLTKTGAVNRTELSVWAAEQGLTSKDD